MIFSVSANGLTASKIISAGGKISYEDGLSWLHVDGRHIKDRLGTTVYLRGVAKLSLAESDCLTSVAPSPYEEFMWHNLVESDFDTIKSLGANVIRLPLSIEVFFPGFGMASGEQPNADFLAMLDNIVNWCEARNIYLIPNLHYYYDGNKTIKWPDDLWTNPIHRQHVDDFWVWLVDRYKNRPVVCGIDYLNEPWHRGPPNAETWRNWVETAIDKVRAVNPHILCIIEDPVQGYPPLYGENSFKWMYDTPVRRDNIILSPHLYPYDGNWNWMSGTDWGAAYAEGRYDEGKKLFADWIWDQWCGDLNVPFWVGEFACLPDTVGLEWLKDFYEIMNDWGWSHAYWAWQALYTPQTEGWPQTLPVEGDWHTLRPQGEIIKAYLP